MLIHVADTHGGQARGGAELSCTGVHVHGHGVLGAVDHVTDRFRGALDALMLSSHEVAFGVFSLSVLFASILRVLTLKIESVYNLCLCMIVQNYF